MMAAIAAAETLRAAARPGQVTLLERTRDGGRKILISGGGRCNILPSRADVARFVTDSSRNSLRNILKTWPLAEQQKFFNERLALDLTLEEESGKLFPRSNRARDVRDGLLALATGLGVHVRLGVKVEDLEAPSAPGNRWIVKLDGGERLEADAVVLATGGLSVPATGSDGTGLRVTQHLGHVVHATYPALTPLTTSDARHTVLSGVSLPVTLEARAGGTRHRAQGGFLFTHRGYSGPSVLDISHLAVRSRLAGDARQEITVQWGALDATAWDERLKSSGAAQVGTVLKRELPERLAGMLLEWSGVDAGMTGSQLRKEDRRRLVEALVALPLPWTGDEGYRKAEVTGGGVALSEIDPVTMESRRCPGLFLCGELLDAFGPIGGYNFMWAWATGRAAGIGAAR